MFTSETNCCVEAGALAQTLLLLWFFDATCHMQVSATF